MMASAGLGKANFCVNGGWTDGALQMSYFSNLAHTDPHVQTGGVGAWQTKGGDEKPNTAVVVCCLRSNSEQIIGHKLDRNIAVDTWARSLLNSAWAELFYTANLSWGIRDKRELAFLFRGCTLWMWNDNPNDSHEEVVMVHPVHGMAPII